MAKAKGSSAVPALTAALPRAVPVVATTGARYSAYRAMLVTHHGSLVVPAKCPGGILMEPSTAKRRHTQCLD
jgi:hypothetical protein